MSAGNSLRRGVHFRRTSCLGLGFRLLAGNRINRTTHEFLWVAIPKVASAGLQLLTNLLLVRRMGPDRSGILFVCVTSILLSDAVLGSAFDVAVIRLTTAGGDQASLRSLRVQRAALVFKTGGCLLLSLFVALWSRSLSGLLFHRTDCSVEIVLSCAAVLGLLALRSVQTHFQIRGNFAVYGLTDICHGFLKFGGIGLLLAARRATPVTVLFCHALGPLSVSAYLLATKARGIATASFSSSAMRQVLSLAKWYLGSAAAGSVTSRMDILVVSAAAGTVAAGVFSAAQLFAIPFQLVGMYLGVVFAPRIIPLWEKRQLASVFRRFQTSIILISLLIYGLALLVSTRIVHLLIPSAFQGTAAVVLVLLPSALMALVNYPWTVSLLMFTHPRFLLVLDVCAIPVLLFVYRDMIAAHGPLGAAAVTSAYQIFKTVVFQVLAGITLGRKAPESFAEVQASPQPSPAV